jgi:hypothetical protein
MTAILSAAAVVAGVWALLTALLFAGQRSFLYFPDTRAPDPAPLVAAGLAPLPVRAGDLELTAWFRPPTAATGLTVVLFQGNGATSGTASSSSRRSCARAMAWSSLHIPVTAEIRGSPPK